VEGLQAEACDGDRPDPESTPESTFLGSPACDVNGDNFIDLTDLDCLDRTVQGLPATTCATPELPTVRTVLFLPLEHHALADDPNLLELVRNKQEEMRRYFARNNGGSTFRTGDVEIFKAKHDQGVYCVYGQNQVINYETVLDDLGVPGYVEPSNRALTPWNRAIWAFVYGGSDSVVSGRFPNGHGYALMGDAILTAARDLDCSHVNPTSHTDPVKDTCLQVWLKSGNVYGHTMGRSVQALARALGAQPIARDAPGWSQSLLGDYRGYPRVGLDDAARAVFGLSQFFAGNTDKTRPEVTLLTPVPGETLKDPFVIRALARDDVGVKSLQVYIDHVLVPNTETLSPFEGDPGVIGLQYEWDPNSVAPGLHDFFATASDVNGNSDSVSIQVTVVRRPVSPQ
jgi:hypothetical protein